MSKTRSYVTLETLGKGAATEMFQAELERVIANIHDPNTKAKVARGIALKMKLVPNDLPNPVTLRPFRTFPDTEQPASKLVLRIRAGEGSGPKCALFEADGGAWKNTVIA